MKTQKTKSRRPKISCKWKVVIPITLAAQSIKFPVYAWEFSEGDWSGAVQATSTVGTAIRTSPTLSRRVPTADAALVGVKGTAPAGVNSDDSNLNYKSGEPVSSVAKAVVDFEAKYKKSFGVFMRVKGWYDHTLLNSDAHLGNIPNKYSGGALSDQGFARGAKFRNVLLDDFYVEGQSTLAQVPFSLKIGQQTVNWGPSFAIPGGLRDINPRDYAALSRPGAQPQEGWVPFLAVSGKADITPDVSLDAFVQFRHENSTLPGCGTFAATADYVAPGCNLAMTSSAFTSPGAVASGRFFTRRDDVQPHNLGQFGVGGSYLAKDLGTKFSLYYTNIHSRDPYVDIIRTGRASTPFLVGNSDGKNPQFQYEFPENIKMISGTFASTFPGLGIKISGEIDHKFNQPIGLNSNDLLAGSLDAPSVLLQDFRRTALGGAVRGYDRFHVTQAQIGGAKDFANVFHGLLTLGAEMGMKYVHGLPDPNYRRYGRTDFFGSGPLNGACAVGADPAVCTTKGFVTPFSWGYRLNASLSFQDILPDFNFKPGIAFAHDVSGWSYDGAFNKGRQIIRLTADGTYKKQYFFNVTYNTTLAGPYDPRLDRDFVMMSMGVKL